MVFQSVLAQYSNPYDETVYITIRDHKTGVEQTIVSNRIHLFFVQMLEGQAHLQLVSSEGHDYQGPIERGAWVDAQHLKAGYGLLQADESWAEVVSVRIASESLKAYNLTVANDHTFFVRGAAANDNAATQTTKPVWVHNTCYRWSELSLSRARPGGHVFDRHAHEWFGVSQSNWSPSQPQIDEWINLIEYVGRTDKNIHLDAGWCRCYWPFGKKRR